MTWAAATISGVLFSQEPSAASGALQPWMQLFDEAPLSFSRSPVGAAAGSRAMGPVGDYSVIVTAQPGRTEVQLSAPSSGDVVPSAIQDIDAALASLEKWILKLIAGHSYVRVAAVTHLIRTFDTIDAANDQLRQMLPLPPVPPFSTDLEFALNVPSTLTENGGQRINRLCRWSSQNQQVVQFQVGPVRVEQSNTPVNLNVLGYQIDVNTVLDPDLVMASGVAGPVFSRLVQEVKALIAGGFNHLTGER